MRVDRAREAALDALTACRRNGAWIDGALKQVLKRDGLSGRDAAFGSDRRVPLCAGQRLSQTKKRQGAFPPEHTPKSACRKRRGLVY